MWHHRKGCFVVAYWLGDPSLFSKMMMGMAKSNQISTKEFLRIVIFRIHIQNLLNISSFQRHTKYLLHRDIVVWNIFPCSFCTFIWSYSGLLWSLLSWATKTYFILFTKSSIFISSACMTFWILLLSIYTIGAFLSLVSLKDTPGVFYSWHYPET